MLFKENEGLLFYVSGNTLEADFAKGNRETVFAKDVSIIDDGQGHRAIKCEDREKLAWSAPRNIYSERGTLSFFWRSRYEIGTTEFPIFRVGFADHTSWDQTWLRIDWAGYGFDAMITDRNLKRARVSWRSDFHPSPEEWVHLSLAWDQRYGIRFYVNGKMVGEEYRPEVYDCALGLFGPHSRAISNWNVSSAFNFVRGGDIREIAIFDRMLSDENIEKLSRLEAPCLRSGDFSVPASSLSYDELWRWQNGFRRELPTLPGEASVRKVEIHDAYDIARWYWKACDGIRETTWPGVHNRSRLKGRNDYFQLPDWDCYSLSGKSIEFTVPDEDFNWVEIAGSAHGKLSYEGETLFTRELGEERTVDCFEKRHGGKLVFTNDEIEEPIGDFSLFNAKEGRAPENEQRKTYYISSSAPASDREKSVLSFIAGRFVREERSAYFASTRRSQVQEKNRRLFFQVVIPYEEDSSVGLDGVELYIPDDGSMQPVSLSIQVKDPLWYHRNLMQLTFRKREGEQRLWLDTRDRILPEDRCLYMTIAADREIDISSWSFTLVLKSRSECKAEHCIDRFTQVRDIYGHLVEEAPKGKGFDLYNRFVGDINDLMKVDPEHIPGQYYLYERDLLDHGMTKFPGVKKKIEHPEEFFRPDYNLGKVPQGVPEWAWWQVDYLKKYKYVVNWYIDNRQIFNGEFGGGLSDDGDFTSDWVGLALMGSDPEKIIRSVERLNDAFYSQGMFTNGLCSIQADELHSSEEGITCLAQCCAADYGNPKYLERAMENVRGGYWITGINKAGHRHFRSAYFSGSKMSKDMPWAIEDFYSGIALSPAWFVARFNGNEKTMKLLTELSDGIVAHYDSSTGILHGVVEFETDRIAEEFTEGAYTYEQYRKRTRGHLFTLFPAYRLTGNSIYYDVLEKKFKGVDVCYVKECNRYDEEADRHLDKAEIAAEYRERCYHAGVREYYNTLGSPWIDRVEIRYQEIQYDRLAGIGYERRYVAYPRNMISWRFEREGDDESIAILSPVALDDRIKLIICNISDHAVEADMLGAEMTPGRWSYSFGIDESDSDRIENLLCEGELYWERGLPLHLSIPAGRTCVFDAHLVEKSSDLPQDRYDLGISRDDLFLFEHGLNVRIHSLGAVPSPEGIKVVLKRPDGSVALDCELPSIEAPTDLYPRTWDVIFNTWQIEDLTGYTVEIDPESKGHETTRNNNSVRIDAALLSRLKEALYEAHHRKIF
ncbi:MAG: hypothetical protein IJ831_11120 [Spirochaetales bacterium]|nr:hypothetical protein [Spirochaetales bacterium]